MRQPTFGIPSGYLNHDWYVCFNCDAPGSVWFPADWADHTENGKIVEYTGPALHEMNEKVWCEECGWDCLI